MSAHDLYTLAAMGYCGSNAAFDAAENGYDPAYGPALFRFGDPDAKKTEFQEIDEMLLVGDETEEEIALKKEDDGEVMLSDDERAAVEDLENDQRDDYYNSSGNEDDGPCYYAPSLAEDAVSENDEYHAPERRTWRSDNLKWYGVCGGHPTLKECKKAHRNYSHRGRRKRVERCNFTTTHTVYVSA